MKKLTILYFCLSMSSMLYAQVSKPVNNPTAPMKTGTSVTEPIPVTNIQKTDKSNSPEYQTAPNGKSVLAELESAVHSNPQMLNKLLNDPSTSQRLVSLTGTDRIKASQLLMELEHKLMSVNNSNQKASTPSGPTIENNSQTAGQLEKVRQFNQLMTLNIQGSANNGKPVQAMNPQGVDYAKAEQRFQINRMETEKQMLVEMENYRNEIFDRLIQEEYYRLINDKTPEMPNNNLGSTSKIAKYKTLRNLLQEQISRKNNANTTSKSATIVPVNNPKVSDNLMQQLDSKIREEEQRTEMMSRHRMEMEMRMEQEYQKQLPAEKTK